MDCESLALVAQHAFGQGPLDAAVRDLSPREEAAMIITALALLVTWAFVVAVMFGAFHLEARRRGFTGPKRRGVQVIRTRGLRAGYVPPSASLAYLSGSTPSDEIVAPPAALRPSPGIQILGGGNEIHQCRVLLSKVQALRIDVEDMRDVVAASLVSGARIPPYLQCRGCNLDVSHPLMRGALDGWGYCFDCAELRSIA